MRQRVKKTGKSVGKFAKKKNQQQVSAHTFW